MNVTTTLFDRWKAAKGLESDRAALKALGLSSGAAVHWRNGREAGADVIERLALDLGDDPAACISAAMANQTQGDASRTWARLARRFGAAAAVACVAVALSPEVTDGAFAATLTAVHPMHYAKLAVALIVTWAVLRWRHGPAPVLA